MSDKDCFKEGERVIVTWDLYSNNTNNSFFIGTSSTVAVINTIVDNPTTGGQTITFLSGDLESLIKGLTSSQFDVFVRNIKLICLSKETVAFNEILQKWSTFYGYSPDYIIENGIDIITFKNGELYTHNTNDVYNNFYGEQQDSRIEAVSREQPGSIKFYKNIEEESTTVWDLIEGKNQIGQSTNLIKEDFETVESFHYAAFWKDANTPNIDNPLIEGEDMRSFTMSLLIRNDSVSLEKLFSIGVRYEVSEFSGK